MGILNVPNISYYNLNLGKGKNGPYLPCRGRVLHRGIKGPLVAHGETAPGPVPRGLSRPKKGYITPHFIHVKSGIMAEIDDPL